MSIDDISADAQVNAEGGNDDTLLTGADTGADTGEGAGASADKKAVEGGGQDKGEKDVDPDALVPAKAEDYVLTFGKDISVDEKLLGSFKTRAHELGISQGKAQQLADFYTKNTADSAKAMQNAQASAIAEAEKGWVEQIQGRQGYKQEVDDAKRTLKEFGTPELTALMNQSRLGSHPDFFDFVVKVGKALGEPESRGRGAGTAAEKPLMDRLWPDMK